MALLQNCVAERLGACYKNWIASQFEVEAIAAAVVWTKLLKITDGASVLGVGCKMPIFSTNQHHLGLLCEFRILPPPLNQNWKPYFLSHLLALCYEVAPTVLLSNKHWPFSNNTSYIYDNFWPSLTSAALFSLVSSYPWPLAIFWRTCHCFWPTVTFAAVLCSVSVVLFFNLSKACLSSHCPVLIPTL